MTTLELLVGALAGGITGGVIGGCICARLTAGSREASADRIIATLDTWGAELRSRTQEIHFQLGDGEVLEPGVIAAMNALELADQPRQPAKEKP